MVCRTSAILLCMQRCTALVREMDEHAGWLWSEKAHMVKCLELEPFRDVHAVLVIDQTLARSRYEATGIRVIVSTTLARRTCTTSVMCRLFGFTKVQRHKTWDAPHGFTMATPSAGHFGDSPLHFCPNFMSGLEVKLGVRVERLGKSGGPSLMDASRLTLDALGFGPSAQGDRWHVAQATTYSTCNGAQTSERRRRTCRLTMVRESRTW